MNAIRRLRPSEDSRAVDVASLVNDAYQAAQEQLFSEPTPRLSVASVSAIIAAGEFVVFEVDHRIVGVVSSVTPQRESASSAYSPSLRTARDPA